MQIGITRKGSKLLMNFVKQPYIRNHRYMDVILEKFTETNNAIVIRYDLESYIKGHRGIFYQDRNKFPSII